MLKNLLFNTFPMSLFNNDFLFFYMLKYFIYIILIHNLIATSAGTTGNNTNSPANFTQNSLFQSGTLNLNNIKNTTTTYYYTYFNSFSNNLVSSALAISAIQVSNLTYQWVGYKVIIINQSATGINISYISYMNTTFQTLKISFLSIDPSITYVTIDFQDFSTNNIATASGLRTDLKTFLNPKGIVCDLSHTNYIMPFIVGNIINKGTNSSFELLVSTSISDTTHYNINFTTQYETQISQITFYSLLYDQTTIEGTYSLYIDSNYMLNPGVLFLQYCNNNNFFSGINSFNYSFNQGLSYNFFTNNLTLTNNTTPNFLNYSTWNIRIRSCSTPFIYYMLSQYSCYQTCPNYYFNNFTYKYCQKCYYTCLTCNDQTDVGCITCDTSSNRTFTLVSTTSSNIQVGTCDCNIIGQYDNGMSNLCGMCSYSCKSCIGTANNCTSCQSTNLRTLTSNLCVCNQNYFDNGTAQCILCSNVLTGCSLCNSLSACLKCADGYFINSNNICIACLNNCLTCSNASYCITCNTHFQLMADNTCICNLGYYLNGNVCLACSTGCLTCNSSTNCSICNTNNNFVLASLACSCINYYFLNQSTCLSCSSVISGCINCTNSNNCVLCNNPYSIINGLCSCPSLKFYNSATNTCQSCLPICLTCINNLQCSSCNSSLFLILDLSHQCVCMTNYINVSGICVLNIVCTLTQYYNLTTSSCSSCDIKCSSCKNSSTCDGCNYGLVFGNNYCKCLNSYQYFNSTNLVCQNCSNVMPGCLVCVSSTNCTTCDTSNNFIKNNNVCLCNTGYFLKQSNCILCSTYLNGCLNCSSQTVCTSCDSSKNLILNSGNCICNYGYYLSNNLCKLCNSIAGCLNCSSASNCNVCDTNNYYILSGQSCICQTGYYNSSNTCISCNSQMIGCLSCNSNTICNQCDSTLYYYLNSSKCSCITGYYFNTTYNNCTSCLLQLNGCTNCLVSNICLGCGAGFIVQNTSCLCPADTYYNTTSNTCQSCLPHCLTCLNNWSCYSCDPLVYRILNSSLLCTCFLHFLQVNDICIQNTSCLISEYYDMVTWSCQICLQYCQSCSDNISCNSCFGTLILQNNICVCPSMNTYFNYNTLTCQLCSSICVICITYDMCSGCNTLLNLQLVNNTCICSVGYIVNLKSQCVPQAINNGCITDYYYNTSSNFCEQICGDGILHILQCDDGNNVNGDGCSQNCTIEYFYECFGTAPSYCSYSSAINIQIYKIIKQYNSNTLEIFINLSPHLIVYPIMNFSQILIFNNSNVYVLSYNIIDSTNLQLVLNYNQNLDGNYLTLTLIPPNLNQTFALKSSNVSFQVSTNNNLIPLNYSSQVYYFLDTIAHILEAIMINNAIIFVCAVYLQKMIIIQPIITLEISVLLISLLQKIPVFLSPFLKQAIFANGYNKLINNIHKSRLLVDMRFKNLSYSAQFFKDINYMIILQLIIFMIGVITYYLSLAQCLIKKRKSLLKISHFFFHNLFVCISLINSLNLGFCCGLEIMFNSDVHNLLSSNKLIMFAALVIRIISLYLSYQKLMTIQFYTQQFKSNKQYQLFPQITSVHRYLIGLLIGILNSYTQAIYVVLTLQLLFTLYIIIRRPFKKILMQTLAIINQILIILIIVIIILFSKLTSEPQINSISIVYLISIVISSLIGIVCTIYNFKQKYCNKENESQLLGNQQTNQFTNMKVKQDYIRPDELTFDDLSIDGNHQYTNEKIEKIQKMQDQARKLVFPKVVKKKQKKLKKINFK